MSIRKVTLAALAVSALAASFATAASAEGTLLASWLVNAAAVAELLSVETRLSLTMEDTKTIAGAAAVLCVATANGSVGSSGEAETTEILNALNEKIGTALGGLALLGTGAGTGEGSECRAAKVCAEGTTVSPIEVTFLGLPWHALLFQRETTGIFLLLLFSEGELGYELLCLVLGINSEDKCTSSTKDFEIEVVNSEGDASIPAGAQTEPTANCSQGGVASGKSTEDELTLIKPLEGLLTVSAEGGGSGAEPTTLSTTLSGEGKEGETVTVLEGSKVKDKATLKGKNASTATGKVIYTVYSDSTCKTLVATAGEVAVSGESVPASSEEELEGGKTYYWQAHYSGDSLHQESTSHCGSEVLNVKAATKLATSLTDGEYSGETLETTEELSVADSATLSGTNSSTATGIVIYKLYTDKECKMPAGEAGEVTVAAGAAPSSDEETLAAGTYYWQATYSGDALHQESKSICGTEVDTVKAISRLSTSLSGEGQSDSEISIVEGTGITDDATINGSGASKAGGTVTYDVYSDSECKKLVAESGKVTVTNGDVPASTEEKLEPGTYYWQAAYSGDANNAGETTACGEEVAIVNSNTSLTTSLSGGGQEGETISVPEGTKLADNATLSGKNVSKAGGTVTYDVYSEDECKTLVAEAGSMTVTDGVVSSSSEQALSPGTYYWQASYSGDRENHQSTSGCTEVATVKAATSLGSSLSGGGQSHEKLSVLEGTGVIDQATLSGPDASETGGIVTYDVYSDSECKKLVAESGKVTVTSGSVPASTEEKLEPGTYYWQATYSGDATNLGSSGTCGSEILTVSKTLLTTSLFGEAKSGEEIKIDDGMIHDTATLSGENAFMATGTVKYDIYSDKECKMLVAEAGKVTVTDGFVPESEEETLSPGTYYWQANYSGDAHDESSMTPCGTEVAVVGPPAPSVDAVEFTNTMPVLVDQHGNETEEKPQAIEEFTGHNTVDWESSPSTGELEKSWPVAYTSEATPAIKARFVLPTATKQLILEKRLEGHPTITGHTTLDGETIDFTYEFASVTELEAQVEKHESYVEIGGSTPISANKALPGWVGYKQMAIEWEWTIKIAGTTAAETQALGTSTLNMYTTLGEPSPAPCKTIAETERAEGKAGGEGEEGTGTKECTPIYLSLLNLAATSIEQERPIRAEIAARVWSNYGRAAFLPDPQQRLAGPIQVPQIQLNVYHPGPLDATGREIARGSGTFGPERHVVKYYEFVRPNATADVPVDPRGGCSDMYQALRRGMNYGVGRCGAWAEILSTAINIETGVRYAQVVRLIVSFGRAPAVRECNGEGVQREACSMLVKNWVFIPGGHRPSNNFPFEAKSVQDILGAAGQANENPPGYFWDHAIIKTGTLAEKSFALYDPSYGTGPFPTETELREIRAGRQAPPSEKTVLEQYQNASIEGFCRPVGLPTMWIRWGLPAECKKTTAGELGLLAEEQIAGGPMWRSGLTWYP